LGQSVRSAPGAEPIGVGVPPARLPDSRLVDRWFGREEITAVRHEVSARLGAAGLAGDRLQGFVLAVNELITNVVLHAGGHGRVALWLSDDSALCSVTDSGPGIPPKYLVVPEVPGPFEVGGRGIWLAHQLSDEVTIATGPLGTTIGLRISLARHAVRGSDSSLNW
jgi:anti-sigma regulatory factor (Ser/Thr protein kinase)